MFIIFEVTAVRRQFDRIWAWLFGGVPSPAPTEAETTEWCLVGNVVDEHAFGESKELRRGSKHFTAGTKVYCLPAQWGDGFDKAVVVGIARGSRRWITVVMSTRLITNWRANVVYKPAVLRRLREGFNEFNRQWQSRKEVEAWVEALRRRPRSGG